jgi:hypothetical protein
MTHQPLSDKNLRRIAALIIAAPFTLAGCGGGSSSSPTNQSSQFNQSTPNNLTLTGVVATGAPVANATLSVVDTTGTEVGSGTTDANGAYTLNIDSTATPPFVIRASGVVGDSVTSLYSVTSGTGIANISQVTNAIAATLSKSGNPADLYKSPEASNINSTNIKNADSSYTKAFSNVLSNISNATTSFINSSYTLELDKALDNIKAQVKPSGEVFLATSSGLSATDVSSISASPTQTKTLVLAKGVSPDASASNSLPSIGYQLSVGDLEQLRSALENCFSIPSTNRGTSNSPSAQCADSKFVVSNDPTVTDGFRQSGWRWTNPTSNPALHPYYTGIFGTLLSRANYDNAKFLKPRIIRPIDSQGNSWSVIFPMKLSDGSLTSLGDIGMAKNLVVKRISSLVSSTDSGYRFIGDQRDYSTVLYPTIQKLSKTSGIAYQTGLYSLFRVYSTTDSVNRHAVMANIQGKGLPPGGIYLGTNSSECGNNSNASMTHSFLGQFFDGTPSAITDNLIQNNSSSINWSSVVSSAPICTSVFRMSEVNQNETGAISLKSWGSDGNSLATGINDSFQYTGTSTNSGNWLSDTDLKNIQFDEPYKIKIWLSDGNTVSYINRLPTSMLTLSESINYPAYPDFSQASKDAIRSFNGLTDFTAQISANPNLYIYQAGLFWNNSATFTINGLAASVNSSTTVIPCANNTACTNGDWSQGHAFIKAFARTIDSLAVSHIFMNN